MNKRLSGQEMLVNVIKNHFGGYLFHRTDNAHLQSIEQHGILSAREAQARSVIPAFPGGNSLSRTLDMANNLDDMVFLSFFNRGLAPRHKDAHRRQPVTLLIAPEILYLRGVKIALGRAHNIRTDIYSSNGAYYNMDWDIISGNVDETELSYKSRYIKVCDYEILIPKTVPREYIAHCISDST